MLRPWNWPLNKLLRRRASSSQRRKRRKRRKPKMKKSQRMCLLRLPKKMPSWFRASSSLNLWKSSWVRSDCWQSSTSSLTSGSLIKSCSRTTKRSFRQSFNITQKVKSTYQQNSRKSWQSNPKIWSEQDMTTPRERENWLNYSSNQRARQAKVS